MPQVGGFQWLMYVIGTPGSLLFSAVRVLELVLPFGSKVTFAFLGERDSSRGSIEMFSFCHFSEGRKFFP